MNTKSMILVLNSLILCNSMSHGFSMASVRKKLMNTCASVGKKSVALISLVLAVLLVSLSVKGGASALSLIKTPLKGLCNSSFTTYPPRQVYRDRGAPHFRDSQWTERQPNTRRTSFARAAAFMSYERCGPLPSFGGSTSVQQERPIYNSSEEADAFGSEESPPLVVHFLPKELRGTRVKTSHGFIDNSEESNLLELIPPELVQLITQFIHQGDLYHDRSLYVPIHHTDPYLLRGNPQDNLEYKQGVSINFIDGDPHTLEIVLCSPTQVQYWDRNKPPSDTITLTHSKTIKKNTTYSSRSQSPISYIQKGIGDGRDGQIISSSEAFFKNEFALPLRQQFSCIDRTNQFFECWPSDHSAKKKGTGYERRYEEGFYLYTTGGLDQTTKGIKYGIQRNLARGRVVWFLPKGELVGVYEKKQGWYDEDDALKHSNFKSVKQDSSGDTFYLTQVIKEQTPVRTISLPHTPVYIKDAEGKEIKGRLGRSPWNATAHLRDESEYPENIDIVALGFNPTRTNNRCSLYRQRGDRLTDYPPELLLHQKAFISPSKSKEILYGDEPIKMPYSPVHLGLIMALRYLKSRVLGRSVGYLE